MRSIVLVIIAFGLTACPFTVNQLNRLPATQPLAQPVLFNRPGPLLHEASGFEFPDWYDNFQRVTAYRYDTGGLDVGIGYNDRRPDCFIAATFYVYPAPRMSFVGASPSAVASMERGWLNNEFARAKAGIEHHHPAMQSPVVGPAAQIGAGRTSGAATGRSRVEAESENGTLCESIGATDSVLGPESSDLCPSLVDSLAIARTEL